MARSDSILIIDDDPKMRELLFECLAPLGYEITQADSGQQALELIADDQFNVVLLDLMLPDIDGMQVFRDIRKQRPETEVIVLTGYASLESAIDALRIGAYDYVAKPFSPKVLFSRAKAVLRRAREPEKKANVMIFGEFTLVIDRYLLKKGEFIQPITLSEFGILRRLHSNRGKVLTRNQLLDDIHNDDAFIVDRNIDVHIASLRKKLGPNFHWIETVRGVGYRFKEEEAALAQEAE